jgi:Uma2 family endonuclease
MSTVALKIEDLPHYTYDDYIQWEGQWELIHGIPYAMTPAPSVKHQELSLEIAFQLKALLKNCSQCKVLPPVDWQITGDTVVQPDVLVVCGDPKKIRKEKLTVPPVMVFEILSPKTVQKDKVLKYQLYQNAGVKYYCIIDPKTLSAVVFVMQEDKYRQEGEFNEGKMVFDIGFCQFELDFGKIFSAFK